MTLFVDASAFLKRYLDEPDRELAEEILGSDSELVTARLSLVEIRRVLYRELLGTELAKARTRFASDSSTWTIVDLSAAVCEAAAEIAETTQVRTLDALHLGAARETSGGRDPFVTFDVRQARAARSLGWTVLGV